MHTANSFIRSSVFLYCLILQSRGIFGSAKGGMSRRRTRRMAVTYKIIVSDNFHGGARLIVRDFEGTARVAISRYVYKIHRHTALVQGCFSWATSIIHFTFREPPIPLPVTELKDKSRGINARNPIIRMTEDWNSGYPYPNVLVAVSNMVNYKKICRDFSSTIVFISPVS